MRIDIKFICDTCDRENRSLGRTWPDHVRVEWDTLSDVLDHQWKNPTHEIRAESEVEIHL